MDENRDGKWIALGTNDHHRDLSVIREEPMKEPTSMIGEAKITTASRLIPADGCQSRQFSIGLRKFKQPLERIAIFRGKFERRTVVMLALRRAGGANPDAIRFVLSEEHTADFNSSPRITAIPAHCEFGDLCKNAGIATHFGDCASAAPYD
jgi:hypothetical protein